MTDPASRERAALDVLQLLLRLGERRRSEKLAETDRRGRAAFLQGAEAQSQSAEGRPLTGKELERVIRRYP